MEREVPWKDFWEMVEGRLDYRTWLYCDNPEEKRLRGELFGRMSAASLYAGRVRKVPMPEGIDGKPNR